MLSRRRLLTSAAGAAALTQGWLQRGIAAPAPDPSPPVLNDASRLNPVPIFRNVVNRAGIDDEIVERLRTLLKDAGTANRPVCVHGARHSQGGQSLARDGFAVSLASLGCVPDRERRTYRVRAGTRWHDVIRTLDPLGFSPAVMQSNSDFSIGGTLSVNAHGWPTPFGPFGVTVRSFRLLLADGTLLTCSRTDNAELFGLVIGGYGLFGIVVDAEIEMADNVLLAPRFETVPAARIAERFVAVATEPSVRMAFGRLSVAREGFLGAGLIGSFRPVAPQPDPVPSAQRSGAYSFLSRQLFRAQIGSERAKKARWYAETVLLPKAARPLTRNAILSYPVAVLAERGARRTDILHEYFLPAERFADFLAACRQVISPAHELLNVTLRYLAADTVSVLSFAPAPRVAAVMLFSQPATTAADEAAREMTERLIDAVLKLGGSFYLPYRLHARADQIKTAYPRIEEFIAKKRHYDPQLRFRNLMWDRYFA
jgi:FAD/FMN-containing dehydrogenase